MVVVRVERWDSVPTRCNMASPGGPLPIEAAAEASARPLPKPAAGTDKHHNSDQPQLPRTLALPRESEGFQSKTRTAATTAFTNANLQQKNNPEKIQTQTTDKVTSDDGHESEVGGRVAIGVGHQQQF